MNYERVYMMYYAYTTIVVLFTMLSLGKFFCVKVLYDWYDTIDDTLGYTLHGWIIAGISLLVISLLALYFESKAIIFICLIVMFFAGFIISLALLLTCFVGVYQYLKFYHHEIRRKKKM